MRILKGVWPCLFLSNISILRGQNLKKFSHAIVGRQQITIWDKTVPQIKKLKKTDPHLKKQIGVCFLQLLDLSTPKASNCNQTAHKYFVRNHSYKNSFKLCKISYNLINFCQIWEFKVSKESRDSFLCSCTLSM